MAIDSNPRPRTDADFPPPLPEGRDSLAVSLRPLSFGMFLALLVAVAVFVGMYESEMLPSHWLPRLLFTAGVVLVFLVPLSVVYIALRRRMAALERLAEITRLIGGGEYGLTIPSAGLPPEGAELARALEQVRASLVNYRDLLHQQEHLTSEIVAGLGEGLLAIDESKKVVLVNRRFVELFAVGDHPEGKPFLEIVRNAALVGAFDAALRGEESYERVPVDVGGAVKQIELRAFPLRGRHDVAAAALFIDVTRLEQLERVRRDFIADFSHEVRTPLAGIRSAVETLEHGGLDSEQEQQLLQIVIRQMSRLEVLAHEVGELKQIESGEVDLERRDVDLLQMVRSLCNDLSRSDAARGMKVVANGAPAVAFVDPRKMEQVFTNLINNALKYGGRGGEVRVEVVDGPDHATVRVIDFGEGIPQEEQERIFHRFYRMDRSRTAEGAGTGLGLAIAKHLVLLHGGTISVQSAPGRGATFEVRLPKHSTGAG